MPSCVASPAAKFSCSETATKRAIDLENVEASLPWRVHYGHDIEDDGEAGRAELANACAVLWLNALKWYYTDCASALRGKGHHGDKGEALDDLTGSRRLLANLCHHIDADTQRIGDAMAEALDAGNRFEPGRMNRPVPERPEDYGTWQAKTRGKTTTPWRDYGGGLGLGR